MFYSVNLLNENGNIKLSEDFETIEEAMSVYEDPWSYFNSEYHCESTVAFEIEGPSLRMRKINKDYISTCDYFEELEEAYRHEEELDAKLDEAIRINNFGISYSFEE